MGKSKSLLSWSLIFLLFAFSCTSTKKKWEERISQASTRELELLLDSIHQQDQKYRKQMQFIEEKYGFNSPELNNLYEIIAYTDSCNQEVVQMVLDQKGWLGVEEVGYEANMALFLVTQHSDLDTQLKYLPMIRVAAREGKANKSSLALMEDRVALRKGGKQKYGSQVGRNTETGEPYVLPLLNPDSVDVWRSQMGLGKLEYYLKPYGIDWKAEKEKQETSNGPK